MWSVRKLRRIKTVAAFALEPYSCGSDSIVTLSFSTLKGLIGSSWTGQLPRLHCFSIAAPDSISQGKANGLGSRAQTTWQRRSPKRAGTDLALKKGSCYECKEELHQHNGTENSQRASGWIPLYSDKAERWRGKLMTCRRKKKALV